MARLPTDAAPSPHDDVAFAGVAGQLALLRSGAWTSRRLVELSLTRIRALDGELRAFREVWAERALAEADRADAARARGEAGARPLLGLPVAIKDVTAVEGISIRSGTGSPEPVAKADSELVQRLRAAGAVPVGLTVSPELALWPFTESASYGDTRNPWARGHQTGGSSGGSAVAVAAGLVPLAHATDGGGSIRIPAAACGLVGLKPTVGTLPLDSRDHWHGLSAAGFVTRTVEDTAVALDALLGGEALQSAVRAPPRRLRVAVTEKAPVPVRLHAEVRRALHETVELLRRLGHEVVEGAPAYGALQPAFLARYLRGAYDDWKALVNPRACEPRTQRIAWMGARVPAAAVRRARAAGEAARERLGRFPGEADVLLTPTLATPPPVVGRWGRTGALRTLLGVANYMPHTPAWNHTGQPAMSVPAGHTPEGLPLAVQLVGRMHDEATLLALAAQLEGARGWPARRPPLIGPA